MGPVAGIGDSLVVGTLIPILLGIGMGLATGGNPIGPIFYIIAWNILITFGMKFLYKKGYEMGGKAVADKPFLVLNDSLNSVYPNFLSGAFVILCWWLMTKKKLAPTTVMLILVVIAFVGVLIGFFDPNLSY